MASSRVKTDALYQKDSTLLTHTSILSSLSPFSSIPEKTKALFKAPAEKEPFILTSRETIFHAQGGGQPSDIGTISVDAEEIEGEESGEKFVVHQVRKVEIEIMHMGVFEPASAGANGAGVWKEGVKVRQCVDGDVRRLHSRLHTGGHALGLAIYLLVREGVLDQGLKDGKASHYPGAAFVEFVGLIPGDKKAAIQEKVDELVKRDLDVAIHFWSEEEASAKCISGIDGAAVEGEESIRVVEIGGLGSYPCGGTHVGRLGELGRVVVRGIKRQKGITKVSYEVVDG